MHRLPYWRLSAYYYFYFAYIGVFSPYFGLYLQSLGFGAWDIALLMSQMQLMRVFGPNLWGWIADRSQRRLAIVRLAALLGLVAFAAFFFVRGFAPALAAMAAMAFFWSAALPLVESLTFDHLRDEPGRYSRIRVWGSIGFIAAVLGTGALLDYVPLDGLLWVSVACLAGIVACALVLPETAHSPDHDGHEPMARILRQPRVAALLAACFFMSAAHGALYVFYSIFLADHGYAKSLVGGMWSIGVFAEIGVFLLMARLMLRFSLRTILIASFAAAVVRFLLIGWGVESPAVLVFAQLLHGLTFGSFHATAIAAVNRWFPGTTRGRGQALYSSLSFGAGGLCGGVLAGWAWEPLGAAWTYTLSSALAAMGLGLVLRWVRD